MKIRTMLNTLPENVTGQFTRLARGGAVAVLVAFLIIPLLAVTALVVDLGYAYVVQAELQATADAAVLAAAGEMSRSSTDVYTQKAIETAKLYAGTQSSLGMPGTLEIENADIEFGDAVYDETNTTWTFVPGSSSAAPYAIRVTVRRDGTANPLVSRFFSKIFGNQDGVQTATASAMITPRDLALVVDLSLSMTFDSLLYSRNNTQINLRDIWVTMSGPGSSPSTKIVDGKEFVTNYELREPSTSVYAGDEGETFGSMTVWGTTILQGNYNQTEVENDPGLYHLPMYYNAPSGGWASTLGGTSDPRYQWLVEDLTNPRSLKSRGHSDTEITNLLARPGSEYSSTYRRRVKIVLGLSTWNDSDNDDYFDSSEVTNDIDEPYAQGVDWDNWINDVRYGSGWVYSSGSYFRERYGLKQYINWLMERQFGKNGPVSGSSGYTPALQQTVAEPLQSVKDAIDYFSEYLQSVESNDNVGLVVYGTQGASDPFSETNGLSNDFDVIADLPYPHQSGEYGPATNTAEPLLRAFMMIHGPGSRPHAHKVIVFMSDGYTSAYNDFSVITDLESQSNIDTLNGVTDLTSFEQLFGGVPSGYIQTGSTGSSAATNGRNETLAIAEILASNLLGMGDVEFNVVGVGSNADISGLLQPLAQASGGDAYHAQPDINNPAALQETLKQIYRDIGGKRPVALIQPGT